MVYLGLGSNIGNRIEYINSALRQLPGDVLQNLEMASIYETGAMEYTEQPKFLNTVCRGNTIHDPMTLLKLCQAIEQRSGRTRDIPKGPRTLDIDILLYDDVVMQDPQLTIPHPRMHTRRFVLYPLLELSPSCSAPDTHTRYDTYLESTEEQEVEIWTYKQ